jgi:hypothetical protein
MTREFTNRERYLIKVLAMDRREWSFNDVARVLNDVLPEDNMRERSGSGVRQFIAKEKGGRIASPDLRYKRKE